MEGRRNKKRKKERTEKVFWGKEKKREREKR